MNTGYTQIQLKKGKEKSLERYHPWIYSGAIKNLPDNLAEGELVEVISFSGNFLGIGYYQIGSIAVHILSFKPRLIDQAFWKERIQQAIQLRETIGLIDAKKTTVYRLIHGEGDGMPGLVVDYYAGCLVYQAHTVAMHLWRETIVEVLLELFQDQVTCVYDKSENSLPFKAKIEPKDEFVYGSPQEEWKVQEYGNAFLINVISGQKTGFYVDQRENRQLLAQYAKNSKVLNTFCYSGGFSIYALRAGASLVHSVDSSSKAIELTENNVKLNQLDENKHQGYCEDVFSYLQKLPEEYDVIILDPPAFAKHKRVLKQGINGYRTINEKAIKNIKSGGILFTFSCSQVITMDHFRTAVFSAAARSGRSVRVLHQLHQPSDHPVSIFHPEGEYLKGLVLEVN